MWLLKHVAIDNDTIRLRIGGNKIGDDCNENQTDNNKKMIVMYVHHFFCFHLYIYSRENVCKII